MIHPLLTRLGRTRAFTAVAPHVLPRLDMVVHRMTRGRWLPSRMLLPTVVLTTRGHRSGQERATPLCAHRFGDGSWLVAATNFGREDHPAWSTNLLRHPHGTVTADHPPHAVTATLLNGEDVARQRQHILRVLPVFDYYAARARRDIRVFHLMPVDPERS
ncbi:nitroreductase family deazaflavin-dependent oxidoreductase [Amycolatopsis magusensis]|uniref:Deazaflavin-dependent oxidoreductase (Nitroreductase family) n=1 Tax=Amycolatopsis magusensis TaxID=882444 RepID=A0ABS4PW97_9PSEU|nr:nitroreductase family deazaflavin-dependent oxidoreductase [Amycolatopsis magusensis]MBP2183706.1 deazaflavin-dependent oxidoreductase (nitroreductase family) [Amycolatopsis magusensis]